MTPTTIVCCRDCSTALPEETTGWLRCPNCATAYCADCARAHHSTATGECDSTAACTACGATCLVDY
jgi:hypothetical protein